MTSIISLKTETGIDLSSYKEDKNANLITITKDIGENFLYSKATYKLDYTTNPPSTIMLQGEAKNINLQSIETLISNLDDMEAEILNYRDQLSAILMDMQSL